MALKRWMAMAVCLGAACSGNDDELGESAQAVESASGSAAEGEDLGPLAGGDDAPGVPSPPSTEPILPPGSQGYVEADPVDPEIQAAMDAASALCLARNPPEQDPSLRGFPVAPRAAALPPVVDTDVSAAGSAGVVP